jgi:hypothetical protein
MQEFWDNRYKEKKFAYGETPNKYLKEQLSLFVPGKILFPAEGEGRNAVFAAQSSWRVSAFDLSEEGKKKADLLAEKNHVKINYKIGEFGSVKYDKESFDAIGLIYAHFSANTKSAYHKILDGYLRAGGIIIFEAFSKKHIQFNSVNQSAGGPKDEATLFSIEEIQSDFANYEVIDLYEAEIDLKEGAFHNGKASVIRFTGKKRHQ